MQVAALEENRPLDLSRRVGNQSQDAERRYALAGARFAHEADHFAGINVEAQPVDGLGSACFGVEIGSQVPYLQQRSLAVCSPQPRKLFGVERFAHGFTDKND